MTLSEARGRVLDRLHLRAIGQTIGHKIEPELIAMSLGRTKFAGGEVDAGEGGRSAIGRRRPGRIQWG